MEVSSRKQSKWTAVWLLLCYKCLSEEISPCSFSVLHLIFELPLHNFVLFFSLFFLDGDRMAMSQATLVLFIARDVQRKSVAQFEDTISFYLVCSSSWPWKSSIYCCILFLLGMHRAGWSCAFSLLFKSNSKLFRTWKHKTNETHQTCHKCYWRMLQLWEQRHKLKKPYLLGREITHLVILRGS